MRVSIPAQIESGKSSRINLHPFKTFSCADVAGVFISAHMSPIYINAPFSAEEYKAVEKVAKNEGRSKGQQVRLFALQALKHTRPTKAKGRGTK